ncbi:hypothetical protein B1987_04285 [Mycobacterium kansasii]|nr:hypothetical protein B1987_04285 [Mycobacterium kansasii]
MVCGLDRETGEVFGRHVVACAQTETAAVAAGWRRDGAGMATPSIEPVFGGGCGGKLASWAGQCCRIV